MKIWGVWFSLKDCPSKSVFQAGSPKFAEQLSWNYSYQPNKSIKNYIQGPRELFTPHGQNSFIFFLKRILPNSLLEMLIYYIEDYTCNLTK